MHDINDLSSGEKEVLYGYLRVRNTKLAQLSRGRASPLSQYRFSVAHFPPGEAIAIGLPRYSEETTSR